MYKHKYRYNQGCDIKSAAIEAWKRYCLARVILGDPVYYYASGNTKVIVYSPDTEFGNTEFEIDVIHGMNSYCEHIIYNEKEMLQLIQDLRPEFERISGETV